MDNNAKIYIAGHGGLIGSAITDRLRELGYLNLLTRSRKELDLLRQQKVEDFFKKEKPDYVILAAARVGGIEANISLPAQFIYENTQIQNNVIHSAYISGVKKLLFFGSACSYPRQALQPMKEEYLLSAPLEPTNESYAIAKIAGIKMCQAYNKEYKVNFISAIPANAYGPGDNFNSKDSHVIPALIRKFQEAKLKKHPAVTIWGSGQQRREFIYVQDIADASLFLMLSYDSSMPINIGTGQDITIKELALIIKNIVGYDGDILFDTSYPDGIPRKLLDISKITVLGWKAKMPLKEGIIQTYQWYLQHGKTNE